ncbi:hypothetical protein [Haloglomus halophilum]|uniref:hypothetical protein n=1 Tax=Haloglomus halophilum TaxID=2962672 RepID=UPI0020C9F589|nr:hypothetical protein [Haloglomus halophilum]
MSEEPVTDPLAIVCGNCGAEHGLGAANEPGMCRECSCFLPTPTSEQHRLLGKRMEQQVLHEEGYVTVGGYVPGVHGPDYGESDAQ